MGNIEGEIKRVGFVDEEVETGTYFGIWWEFLNNRVNEQIESISFIAQKYNKEDIHITLTKFHKKGTKQFIWYFLATDENAQFLGARNYNINEGKDNTLAVTGEILVLQRGQGIASALEATASFTLQNELNNDPAHTKIIQSIHDSNRIRINKSEEDVSLYERKGELEKLNKARSLLARRQKERVSWERLYGENGILGFQEHEGELVRTINKGESVSTYGFKVLEKGEVVDMREVIEKEIEKRRPEPEEEWESTDF